MIKFTIGDPICTPSVGSEGAGAADLRIDRDLVLYPGQVALVGTSVRAELPEGTALLVLPRSSSKLTLTNTIGLIDSDYRGEIKANLRNTTNEPLMFCRGDRILQALLIPVASTTWELVDQLSDTSRGEGGFGSTGVK